MDQVPKFTIVVPLFILLLGIVFRVTGVTKTYQNNPSIKLSPTSVPSKIDPAEAFLNTQINRPSEQKIDLTTPSLCKYQKEATDVTVHIKNKNVAARIVTNDEDNTYLLLGDCFYKWKTGTIQGEKTCGVGQYVSLAESFFSMPILSNALLETTIEQKAGDIPIEASEFMAALKSCVKQPVEDSKFILPKNILFSEKKLDTSELGM